MLVAAYLVVYYYSCMRLPAALNRWRSEMCRPTNSLKVIIAHKLVYTMLIQTSLLPSSTPVLINMQIFIRTLAGKTIPLDTQPSDSVRMLKALVQDKLGTLPEQFYMTYAGKPQSNQGLPHKGTLLRQTLGGQPCALRLQHWKGINVAPFAASAGRHAASSKFFGRYRRSHHVQTVRFRHLALPDTVIAYQKTARTES